MRVSGGLSGLVIIAFLGACGGSPTGSTCVPNATQTCQCSDGRSGVQVCNAAGAAFSVCTCGGDVDSGPPADTGTDAYVAAPLDMGIDMGTDAGTDAYVAPIDMGTDACAACVFDGVYLIGGPPMCMVDDAGGYLSISATAIQECDSTSLGTCHHSFTQLPDTATCIAPTCRSYMSNDGRGTYTNLQWDATHTHLFGMFSFPSTPPCSRSVTLTPS